MRGGRGDFFYASFGRVGEEGINEPAEHATQLSMRIGPR